MHAENPNRMHGVRALQALADKLLTVVREHITPHVLTELALLDDALDARMRTRLMGAASTWRWATSITRTTIGI